MIVYDDTSLVSFPKEDQKPEGSEHFRHLDILAADMIREPYQGMFRLEGDTTVTKNRVVDYWVYPKSLFLEKVQRTREQNAKSNFDVRWNDEKAASMPKDGLGMNNLQRQVAQGILIYGENPEVNNKKLFAREDPWFLKISN